MKMKGKWWVCMPCGYACELMKGWKPRTRRYGYERYMVCSGCGHDTKHVVVDSMTASVCLALRGGFRTALWHIVGVAIEGGKR